MGDLYTIDEGGGAFWQPVPAFDTANEAEVFSAGFGHGGTAILRAVFQASAPQVNAQADTARGGQLIALQEEGNRRTALVDQKFTSVVALAALGDAIKMASFEVLGADGLAVADAYEVGITELDALTTAAAVNAYDVVNTPPWP